jgi:hypothetical protein
MQEKTAQAIMGETALFTGFTIQQLGSIAQRFLKTTTPKPRSETNDTSRI